MRIHSVLRWTPLLAAAFLSTGALTQCKPQGASGTGGEAAQEAAKPQLPFAGQPDKIGALAWLPSDTEFYLGSAQFAKHYGAAKTSRWWKDLSSLVDDKNPANDIKSENVRTLLDLWGDDFFVAGGKGLSVFLKQFNEINKLYNELSFKALMVGAPGRLSGGGGNLKKQPAELLIPFLSDPTYVERAVAILKEMEAAPLLIGIKTADAQAKLDKIITPKEIAKLEEKKIKVADLQTSEGYQFKAATIDLGSLWDEEKAGKIADRLPANYPAETKAQIADFIQNLRTKKIELAWGVVNDSIIFASGKNLEHLKFAKDPSESLVAMPSFAKLKDHEDKDLAAFVFVKKEAFEANHDAQPLAPMIRGVVSAMKENTVFADAGENLGKQLAELAPLEEGVFGSKFEDGAAVIWWDKGLKAEAVGGVHPKFYENGKPLRYADLLNGEKVLFSITYHSDLDYNKSVRNWAEKLVGLIYTGAKELVKSGVGGAQGQQQLAFFEMFLLPTIQKVYQAEKDLHEKGLGGEVAFMLDLEGKSDGIPGAPKDGVPRLLAVSEVKDRAEIANSWKTINDTLFGIAAMVGANMGGGAAGGIPAPVQSENHGFTTWEYEAPIFAGDFTPSSTINDQHLILSTSKPAALEWAAKLANPEATSAAVDGCVWQFDMELLSKALVTLAQVAPKQQTGALPDTKQLQEFLKPFKTMKGHHFAKDGEMRATFEWEIVEPVSFD